MKKIITILLVSIVFTSCIPVPFSKLKEEDYDKYIKIESYNFNNSPLAYNMLRGENGFSKYTWKQCRIKPYYLYYYSSDRSKLLDAYFPDADIIMGFGGSTDSTAIYFVGYKNDN